MSTAWNDVISSLRPEEILGPCKDKKEKKLFGELFGGNYIVPDPGTLGLYSLLESVLIYGANLGALAATNKKLSEDKINTCIRTSAHHNLAQTAIEYAIDHEIVWEAGKEVDAREYKTSLTNYMRLAMLSTSMRKQAEKYHK